MKCAGVVLALGLATGVAPAPAGDGPYSRLKEIPIGGEGGWDYLSVDEGARRLYVSHATKVVVVDLDKDAVVGEIAPAPGVHGIAVAPELGRGFVTNGRANTVSVVDLETLRILQAVETGANPDAVLYEPKGREVYAVNHTGHSVTVFAADTGKVRATIPLPGVGEFAVLDAERGQVFVNAEDTSQLVAIDTASHQVTATWPLAPGEEPTGLAFASSSDGTLTVARPQGDTLSVVQTLSTPRRSRTMTLDPKTHRLYVAAAEFGPPPTGADGRPQRPPVSPGSFRVVVYEMVGPPGR